MKAHEYPLFAGIYFLLCTYTPQKSQRQCFHSRGARDYSLLPAKRNFLMSKPLSSLLNEFAIISLPISFHVCDSIPVA